jgi:hypothetical protein
VSDWSDSDSSAQTERAKRVAEVAQPQPSTSKEPAPLPAPEVPVAAAAPVAVASTSSSSAAAAAAAAAAVAADKWESSNSEHSGDEYNVYYYDPKALEAASAPSTSAEDPDAAHAALFANCKRIDDPWEVLFARAEALHAHGHSKEVKIDT